MHTVAETEVFLRYAASIWSKSGSGGCRKVRWSRSGMGKRGGARVIYFNVVDGRIWLLIAYAKAKFDNLPAEFLSKLKAEVERG